MIKKRKLNKLKVTIVIIIIILMFTITVFGRYIYNALRETYFLTEQFYFSSDILTVNGSHYQFNDWGGDTVYEIPFDLFSYQNALTKIDYDLGYTVTCSTTSTKIRCTINSGDAGAPTTITGTIPATTNTSRVTIFVTPIADIDDDEIVKIQVTASTSVPYQKTISSEFSLKALTQGYNTYSIEDEPNRDYAILRLVGANTISTEVTVEIDPTKFRLDLNDEIYINRDDTKTVITTSGGITYIKKIVFTIPAETTRYVKLYKVDKTKNYTYPGVQATSPVNVII